MLSPTANPLELRRAPFRAGESSSTSAASRVFDAPLPLGLWHLASLDAPTVAAVWVLAFAWAARVSLPAWVPLLLALAAWTVYVGDRLLDARAALRTGDLHRLRQRHHFHWRHRWIFVPLAVAAASAAAWMVLALVPLGARRRDSVLAAAALVYFTRVHSVRNLPHAFARLLSPPLSKEFLVGVLFTAGCFLPAFSRAAVQSGLHLWPLFVPAFFFALLAWLNCRAIEFWESETCGRLMENSIPAKGLERSGRGNESKIQPSSAAVLLALSGLLAAVLLYPTQPRPASLIAAGAASALLLALLDRLRGRLTPLALRAAADLVLLTPLALLLQ